jgi:phosphoribosylamine---glycine ligase
MTLDVLVVGGGGREHALVWALRRSPLLGRLYCAPGNAGIARDAESVPIAADDVEALAAFAVDQEIDLTVVGPEAPLVAGLADTLRAEGLAVFGPGRAAALLEGSKAFAKEIMTAAGVPTGQAAVFTEYGPARAYVRERGAPAVIKADGLAAGKGVIVASTLEEAERGLAACFLTRDFGDAGDSVLVEEMLEGEECSLLALVSDGQVLPLAPAQDYKRIFDSDLGPNTGGMGSYSPVPAVDEALYRRLVDECVRPTVAELERIGAGFRGVLYAGIILTRSGPKVLEYNVRFGDPETQVLLPRLRSDLLELLWATARGDALPTQAEWEPGACVGVVMASRGYPAGSSKGDVITGVEDAEALARVRVFQAGTARTDAGLVTAGGRVLVVSAVGESFADARRWAYEGVGKISFAGEQHRTDIGLRAERREVAAG